MFKNEIVDRLVAMRAVLEGGGIEFTQQDQSDRGVRLIRAVVTPAELAEESGGGPGVRLRRAGRITGAQVREARHLLGWSGSRLNAWANLPAGTVELYEQTGRVRPPSRYSSRNDRLAAIRAALETAGIEFVEERGVGLSLRLKGPPT